MSFWPRKKRPARALDILQSAGWMCANCRDPHHGMIDLAAFAPDCWNGDEAREPNSALRTEGDFLSEDFCVIEGRSFFVRCVLEIPVHGLAEKFGFGCWGTLSRTNFDTYVERFDDGSYQDHGPWTSWSSNRLADYIGTSPEGCWMYPQLHRQRPTLLIADNDHRLAIDQADGISPERVLEIYEFYGHKVHQ